MALQIFYMAFGCKVSQYELQNIRERFEADGNIKTDMLSLADVVVVNTCTVTSSADRKLRHFVKRARRENPDCLIVLAGCFVQAFPDLAESFKECDIFCGTKGKTKIPDLVYEYFETHECKAGVSTIESKSEFEPMCNQLTEDKTRAYIKIQDGCDMNCTYCIIPKARGHICSKPLDDIRQEASILVASNHKEIILTGINLCCYGRDFGDGTRLIDAIEAVCSIDENFRVRLSSIEPEMISDEDILRMSRLKKLCPQFHLSLQSGCDKTLKAMNRHYTSEEYLSLVQKLRSVFPSCAITTDIMVGFPNETDEDFLQSLEFVKRAEFADAHIFPFSRRSGTAADKMTGQLDNATKNARAAKLSQACKESRLKYHQGFVGTVTQVLFERESDEDFHQGHNPEYVVVKAPRKTGDSLFRQLKLVRITKAYEDYCLGEII
ncbi:MAG: tRNA (N(6)-L-threonylcarbamoyladenosine(37)-C(2))-methylthiotransferase MtaB [Ruminococcus sp.]|nr:tRNA (N(6)-L-threonylcarbamoyladenosine(37)-C(2))-methylthiotransferase MtaB [Ruminococcus sp.]